MKIATFNINKVNAFEWGSPYSKEQGSIVPKQGTWI
jgi:hypothetical protein